MSNSSSIYRIKVNKRGERYINLGRFDSKSLWRQMNQEFDEDLGFCVRAYTNPETCNPSILFFRKKDIGKRIKGYANLEKYKVVYINIFLKKGTWIMKIAPVTKGGERMIKGISERGLSYQLYLEECEQYNEEPLSYDEWLKQEEYEQEAIDRLFMTDDEKYGANNNE